MPRGGQEQAAEFGLYMPLPWCRALKKETVCLWIRSCLCFAVSPDLI